MTTDVVMKDSDSLKSAQYKSGYKIQTYDDGFGPLWISRNSLGINGIVRAQTWEDAYSICEDELCIYQKDLNGDSLDPLTAELVEELGIELDIEKEV